MFGGMHPLVFAIIVQFGILSMLLIVMRWLLE